MAEQAKRVKQRHHSIHTTQLLDPQLASISEDERQKRLSVSSNLYYSLMYSLLISASLDVLSFILISLKLVDRKDFKYTKFIFSLSFVDMNF